MTYKGTRKSFMKLFYRIPALYTHERLLYSVIVDKLNT